MAGQIFGKSGIDIMPLETAPNSYFLIPALGNTNVRDGQNYEMG
jgi:hypothetical protein